MSERCTFGSSLRGLPGCRLVAGENGLCPRHAFLEQELGPAKALIAEYGIECTVCSTRVQEKALADCERCETESVCTSCRSGRLCCEAAAEAAEDEANDLEVEASELEIQASQARRRANQIREAINCKRGAA